ncbi:unnamed protein product [Musa acuminata subsp. burmannicoides]
MKSDKPQRPSSGFGKLVLVKMACSPFNLAFGGEGTVRDSCYSFDSSDMRVMLRISDSLRFRHHHPPPPPAPRRGGLQDRRRRGSPPPTRRRGGSTVFHSRHQRFQERPAVQCCYARLYLMKSDKPRRPSSGFGKLVLVKKAWSPFNLALGGEGTVRDSCYSFDSSGEIHFSICRYWFYCCMPLCGIMGCF